jgi:photosystem II stability/assembly factor-like uncharacterized protein
MRSLLVTSVVTVLLVVLACHAFVQSPWSSDDYPNFSIQFVDDRTGWIIGPRLFHTIDGGKTWTVIKYARVEDPVLAEDGPEYRKNYVQFVDRDWGWRCSPVDLNAVEYTENGGHSWSKPVKISDESNRSAVIFINRDHGWTLGTKVFATRDRGRTWQQVPSLNGLELRYPFFLDASHGWFANEWGAIARTTDGGDSWSIVQSHLKDVRALFFHTPTQGWIVGDDGLLATTTDGGLHWTKGSAPVPYNSRRNMRTTLLDVFFLDQTLGWIAGYDGTVLRTTDGGQSWTAVTTLTRAPLSSIRFVDALHGWAVGGNSEPAMLEGQPSNVVIETTDGGKTWRIKTFS